MSEALDSLALKSQPFEAEAKCPPDCVGIRILDLTLLAAGNMPEMIEDPSLRANLDPRSNLEDEVPDAEMGNISMRGMVPRLSKTPERWRTTAPGCGRPQRRDPCPGRDRRWCMRGAEV